MLTLITQPTAPKWLPLLYKLLCDQSIQEWQWFIIGPGPHLPDHRIRHYFSYEEAVEKADGEIILHVDEHTYYAPSYLEQAVYHLGDEKSCVIGAFFGYDMLMGQGLYWSSFEPRWCDSKVSYDFLNKVSGLKIREISYSLASSKTLIDECKFTLCYRKGEQKGEKILADHWGSVVRLINDPKTLDQAPYFRLPPFLFERHLPLFMQYLERRSQC